jgi:hypothetical protein
VLGRPFGYSTKRCSKSLLKLDFILFLSSLLTPPLLHVCFFYFNDICSLGSNGSTKILESLLSLIPFYGADLALVLEFYVEFKAVSPFLS